MLFYFSTRNVLAFVITLVPLLRSEQRVSRVLEWLTGMYIERRCKLCINISLVRNVHEFRVSLDFRGLKKK